MKIEALVKGDLEVTQIIKGEEQHSWVVKDPRRLVFGVILFFVCMFSVLILLKKQYFYSSSMSSSWGDWQRLIWTALISLAGFSLAAVSASFNTSRDGIRFWKEYFLLFIPASLLIAIIIFTLFSQTSMQNTYLFYVVTAVTTLIANFNIDYMSRKVFDLLK